MNRSGTVSPVVFLRACRVAVGCDEFQRGPEGLAATPAEQIRRALSALDSYTCGCLWCEQLGDRSTRNPPGERVVSAYCAARVVADLLGEELAGRIALATEGVSA